MENLETLMGKYGDEGDQLLYRVLHRGERLSRTLTQEKIDMADLAELGLRYDLTVPLARVVAQYGHQLPRFFKRYQIQPVWRADRPQKGRYQEFYQCDVDVVGSKSLSYEAELIQIYDDVFAALIHFARADMSCVRCLPVAASSRRSSSAIESKGADCLRKSATR